MFDAENLANLRSDGEHHAPDGAAFSGGGAVHYGPQRGISRATV
jgi:hypothetical protein